MKHVSYFLPNNLALIHTSFLKVIFKGSFKYGVKLNLISTILILALGVYELKNKNR